MNIYHNDPSLVLLRPTFVTKSTRFWRVDVTQRSVFEPHLVLGLFLISFILYTYRFFVCTSRVCNTGDFCLIRCLAVEPRADMHGINPKQFFEISLCGGQKSSTSWQLRLRVLWNAFLPHTGTFKNKLKLMNSPRVAEFYWFVCWSVTCWLRNIFQKLWWNKAEESH